MTRAERHGDETRERRRRYRRGHAAGLIALALLVAKGYRILGRRVKTRFGEIDLIAVRGRRLAFVEVKRRPTLVAAEEAITPQLQERIIRAAEAWTASRPAFREHELAFDVVLLARGRWPQHRMNAMERRWRPASLSSS